MINPFDLTEFNALRKAALLRLLEMHYKSGVGHIGGNLSALDAMLLTYHNALEANDTFILSKGHAAGAIYVTLWSVGIISESQLDEFHSDGTKLSGHPAPNWIPEIPFATGSLGHGLPISCGIAHAKKLKFSPGKVFCFMSDGEWQEGSNWEALIYASRHSLDNLTILIDRNGLQGLGSTMEIGGFEMSRELLISFGISAIEVDGHDPFAILEAIGEKTRNPKAIILKTIKGKGVSFMENRFEWHYLPLDEQLYIMAIKEIEAG